MQYVRSLGSGVSKTWNSINPATLSGAIDVIVVEQSDGTLACSPFHVRFGKFSLLRPSERRVEFKVNGVRQDYDMKLGDGGEAFFVFETAGDIPEALQTSPLSSPETSPVTVTADTEGETPLTEPTPLDLGDEKTLGSSDGRSIPTIQNNDVAGMDGEMYSGYSDSAPDVSAIAIARRDLGPSHPAFERAASEEVLPMAAKQQLEDIDKAFRQRAVSASEPPEDTAYSRPKASPPTLRPREAYHRALTLSKKLSTSNIRSKVTESGDLMLDMTGYKSTEEEALRAEAIARKLLSEEMDGSYDIGSLIGTDEHGNLWIYSSEEARDAANRKTAGQVMGAFAITSDSASDPGYHSDSDRASSAPGTPRQTHQRAKSEEIPQPRMSADRGRAFAKTLRLTSDQLKKLELQPGANPMSFTAGRATCPAVMYYWTSETPIVISDIDGTITKSDALGHILNMVGRDWTHSGVAKLYTEIVANGYNILYLTSRSVGQADTTRAYLNNINQEGWKLPKGPVILSPDRTIAALRREVYLRKPEVFKMACLRDILDLFPGKKNPFYAGFGNRFTDALSYRTVHIPSTRIFTINTNSEVAIDMMSLSKYRSSYVNMREVVDHHFPPVSTLVKEGGEEFTDFTYWRDTPQGMDDWIPTDSEDEDIESDDDVDDERANALGDSYLSRDSVDQSVDLNDSVIRPSIEVDEEDLDEDLANSRIVDEDFTEDYIGSRPGSSAKQKG
ncbi:Nuclear elongation and deformation protein 1 [Cyphellophora attinorum]|uniref:Nuclear elongation and deformation protein 1 n=1 Tax=Cyphellophora attinorum TaxID=1664694 RepID=A0A0N1H7G7_9EURO|nr:Nuclear elongation and deformation protein 1 [Phialophora attinorum]KPI38937.1 Nuclear elongation and deformation protein 1 [Phialophora attinorum]